MEPAHGVPGPRSAAQRLIAAPCVSGFGEVSVCIAGLGRELGSSNNRFITSPDWPRNNNYPSNSSADTHFDGSAAALIAAPAQRRKAQPACMLDATSNWPGRGGHPRRVLYPPRPPAGYAREASPRRGRQE
ncbi:hypothetical protein MRX96_030762 [Rhipicephalus microplus]